MLQTGSLYCSEQQLLSNVTYCDRFICKFQGLMFRRSLQPEEALLMVETSESKIGTSIHMLFMFIPLTVLWLDSSYTIVDKKLAKPWRLAYFPQSAAKYIIETSTDHYELFQIGDTLEFQPH